jgi:hypothetical protein
MKQAFFFPFSYSTGIFPLIISYYWPIEKKAELFPEKMPFLRISSIDGHLSF